MAISVKEPAKERDAENMAHEQKQANCESRTKVMFVVNHIEKIRHGKHA